MRRPAFYRVVVDTFDVPGICHRKYRPTADGLAFAHRYARAWSGRVVGHGGATLADYRPTT